MNDVRFRRPSEMRDVRCPDHLSILEVGASGGLPGYYFASLKPSDNPDLAVAIHPKATFRERNLAAIYSAGAVVTFVKDQPTVSFHRANCTDHRYSLSKCSFNLLNTRKMAPRHGFEPRLTAPKAAVLPLDDRGRDEDCYEAQCINHHSA